MAIKKLQEFAKDGQKNTDNLNLTDGFSVSKKPARQWFNWLFNTVSLKINEIIDNKIDFENIVNNLTTDDATKPLSAARGKALQDSKLGKTENAVSATKLQTARTIGGVSFDGSANINLPGVNTAGNQNTTGNAATATTAAACSGNAATATKLQTARTIALAGAVTGTATEFDGSGNITINTQLKENTAVARAYVNFSVSGGIVTINKSMNIASVVRNASGVFTLTFANALDDAKYVWAGSAYHPSTTKIPVAVNGSSDLVKSTTQLQVLTTYAGSSTGTIDAGQVSVVVF